MLSELILCSNEIVSHLVMMAFEYAARARRKFRCALWLGKYVYVVMTRARTITLMAGHFKMHPISLNVRP